MFGNIKLYLYGAGIILALLIIWRVNHAFNEAARVPILEEKLEDTLETLKEERKECAASKQPAKESNQYDKKNSDDLLATCLNSLRDTPVCLPASGVASSVNPARKQQASRIEAQKDRNDLNAAKIWAIECIRIKKCN